MTHGLGMIRAVLFDLDGTLVETEELKGLSYARAAVALRPELDGREVEAAYRELVGRSREEVVATLAERFALAGPAAAYTAELGVATPQEAFALLRLRIYESMLADRALIRRQEYPYATALLRRLRRDGYPIGVATMSHGPHARPVLAALDLLGDVDVLVTRDEVRRPKPDPEIYALAAARLGVAPAECLVVEDSPPGVQSALAAGMACVAATTALTRDAVHAARLLPPERVVDDPQRLAAVVLALLDAGAPVRAGGGAGGGRGTQHENASEGA